MVGLLLSVLRPVRYIHIIYIGFAVHDDLQSKGIGKVSFEKAEDYIVANGGKKIVMGTSGRAYL